MCQSMWVSRESDDRSARMLTLALTRLSSRNSSEPNATHCNDCAALAATARRKSLGRASSLPPDSAKIRMILELLRKIDDESGGEEKTIVFSQFTSMLDIIQTFLRHDGIRFARCKSLGACVVHHICPNDLPDDGSMRKDEREASLEKIRNSASTKVILISFKAGSTGTFYTTKRWHWILMECGRFESHGMQQCHLG